MLGSRGTLRWIAGGVALAVAGAMAGGVLPAGAATVGAQLTLSGVASSSNPTGGSTVGVHPGDSVTFTASSLPTAGAPAGLNSLLSGLVGSLAGFDVTIQSGNLPGVNYPYVLSSTGCAGTHKSLSLASLKKGTYKFNYTADSVTVLPALLGGCKYNQIQLSGDQVKKATANQIAVNAKSVYAGQIVVATDPPKGGISIQLPSVSVQPKVGPIQLPKITVPGVTTPTIPTSIPSLTPSKITKPGSGAGGGKATSTSPGLNITQPGLTVPQQVVPQGDGGGAYGGGGAYSGVQPDTGVLGNFAPLGRTGGLTPLTNPKSGGTSATPSGHGKTKTIDLAASNRPSSSGGELPIILAILAIIALSLVAATYSRLYLLRRSA